MGAEPESHTYKQAGKHVLLGVVDPPLVVLFVVLFGNQRLAGVLHVVVIEAAVEAAGRLVTVETVFQITRVATRGGGGGEHKSCDTLSYGGWTKYRPGSMYSIIANQVLVMCQL